MTSELIDIHCPYCNSAITGTRTHIGEATTKHIDRCEAAPESIRGLLTGDGSYSPAGLEPSS